MLRSAEMRDIYVRHRPRCRYAQADFKDSKKRAARLIFGCGCPIYARVEIRNTVTKDILFEHNGSLKGVTAKEAAEELVNTWFVKYLTGETAPARSQKAAVTLEEAIKVYLAEKEGALPPRKPSLIMSSPANSQSRRASEPPQSESLRKIADVIQPLAPFMAEKRITYLKDVRTEHLTEFRQTWKGRRVKDPKTNVEIQLPKSQHGRAKYQEYLKGFFKRSRLLGWISANRAELLEPIRTEDPEIKIYTAHEKKRLLEVIPFAFPKKAAMVRAFVLAQRFSALRISDTVSLEIQSLNDEGITIRAQRKTDAPVYCALPPVVIAALRSFTPKSEKYFFWTGNGQLETACKDWSATMLKLFRKAGIPETWEGGKRSHNWRDTLATEILEDDEGRLEDAQIALGHKSRKTTEKYYTAITKKRTERVTALKRKLWKDDEVV
jgi:integrase